VGVARDCPIFGGTPIISGMGKASDLKFGGYIYRDNPNKSLLKIFDKRERGRIQRVPIFWVPPIISRMDKATDFKFCRNIHRVYPNKSPWKTFGIVAVGVGRDSRKFSGHPCIGRKRCHLCDSTAFLYVHTTAYTSPHSRHGQNPWEWRPLVMAIATEGHSPLLHYDVVNTSSRRLRLSVKVCYNAFPGSVSQLRGHTV